MKYTREQIQNTVEGKGYKYFHDNNNKSYDVNIIGIRNSETKGRVTNAFDDLITISYKCEEGYWHYNEFDCTTDPGTYWVDNLLNPDGVAILKPGQYRGSHKIRLHLGKYEALGQQKPLKVYRDDDRDNTYADEQPCFVNRTALMVLATIVLEEDPDSLDEVDLDALIEKGDWDDEED